MISFKKTIKDKLSTLLNDGESIIFVEDEQSLYIDGDGYRKPVMTPLDQLVLRADLSDGHLYYKYGNVTPEEEQEEDDTPTQEQPSEQEPKDTEPEETPAAIITSQLSNNSSVLELYTNNIFNTFNHKLNDTVYYYNLTPNTKYKLTSSLIDKSSGSQVGDTITDYIIPTNAEGSYVVQIPISSNEVYTKTYVVYHELFIESSTNVYDLVASHKDINDAKQTITIKFKEETIDMELDPNLPIYGGV